MPTLVHGRALLTGRLDVPSIPSGGAMVDGATILAVGPADALRASFRIEREIGGSNRIVMPGLVSAHQHGGGISSMLLGCGDATFERWLIEMYGIPAVDPYLDTLYHALRFIENGITTTVHSHYTRDPGRYNDEVTDVLRGYRDAGIRVTFAPCFMDRGRFVCGNDDAFLDSLPESLAAPARALGGAGVSLSDYLALVTTLRAQTDREWTRITHGPVAPQWCSEAALLAIAEADAATIGVHMHLLESRQQREYFDQSLGRSVVNWLNDLGLVSETSCFAHGVWLRESEIELLAARGARLICNPSCNLRLGNGQAPLGQLSRAGVNVALGTDDMTLDDDDDLFREMRLAGVLARGNGDWLTAATLLHAATAQGAAVAGFHDLTGTLDAGKRADLVLLDVAALDGATESPAMDQCDLVVGRATAAAVASVMIGGRIVLEDQRHVGIDMEGVVRELRDAWRVQSQSGRAQRARSAATAIAEARDTYAAGRVV